MRGWKPEPEPTDEEIGLAGLGKQEGDEVLRDMRKALDAGNTEAARDVLGHLRYMGRRRRRRE